MREAIGGSWLFGIVITFVALFSAFLAYSISYTRAFNVKNEIINLIEQNEGYSKFNGNINNTRDDDLKKDGSVEALAFLKIKNLGYNYTAAENISCSTLNNGDNDNLKASMQSGGYCLTKICTDGNPKSNTYYKVTAFIAIHLPVVNITIKIPISGETRTLYYDSGKMDCSN